MTEAITNFIYEDCKKSCPDVQVFSKLQNQTIYVTGGTGFVGKWIAELISYINESSDYNIKLYLSGRDVEKFTKEVPHLYKKKYIQLIPQDIRNLHDLPKDVNYIIHAAGSPDNRDHVSQPLRTLEIFYKGTLAVFDASTRLPELKKIVHMSSHMIYGKNEGEKNINENFSGVLENSNINQVYTESKRITETLCSIYKSNFKLPILILRPFAFIGPYQGLEKPWAINNFIRDGILGGPIRIFGNGLTVRSYLYASDMAAWILKSLILGEVGESYNLGSNEGISLDDLADKVRKLINGNIEILSKSSRENYSHLSRLVPEIQKITKSLQVKETYTLDESISRTIVWNQLNRQ